MMNPIFKVLCAALSYPTEELQAAMPELRAVVAAESALSADSRAATARLLCHLAEGDLLDRQAEYVDLFDRTKALSLHLFEHVHGESRDRGQAMVSLRDRYRQAGLDLDANELPDYLPLFLEFLAYQPPQDARAMLAETAHILAALGTRLTKRGTPYAALFEALVELAATRPEAAILEELNKVAIDDPCDLAALDRAWEETEVRFGAGDAHPGTCPRADQILQRMTTGAQP
jgi:nitrate reductase delta subunit